MTSYQGRAPLGSSRSALVGIVLYVVTFGVWGLFWVYLSTSELKRYAGVGLGGLLWLLAHILFLPIALLVFPFLFAAEIASAFHRFGLRSPVSALTGLWVLVPFVGTLIWFVKVQHALNMFWVSQGGSPR